MQYKLAYNRGLEFRGIEFKTYLSYYFVTY